MAVVVESFAQRFAICCNTYTMHVVSMQDQKGSQEFDKPPFKNCLCGTAFGLKTTTCCTAEESRCYWGAGAWQAIASRMRYGHRTNPAKTLRSKMLESRPLAEGSATIRKVGRKAKANKIAPGLASNSSSWLFVSAYFLLVPRV